MDDRFLTHAITYAKYTELNEMKEKQIEKCAAAACVWFALYA